MHKLLFRFLWCSHLLVILLCSSVGAKAADWAQPAKELAKQIAEQTSGRAVMLQVQNRSSLQQGEVDAIQDSLRRELTRVGVEQADAKQSGYLVSVTLSENVQGYVWIAEMQKEQSAPTVLIVAVARAQTSGLTMQPVSLILRKVQLWTQREQILDVAVIDSSPPRLVVLDPNRITIQGLHGTIWQEEHSFDLKHSSPWPRDLRGRLLLRRGHLFDAYLPGIFCSSTATEPLSMTCRESDDPWPIGTDTAGSYAFFSPSRNFFTGALAPAARSDRAVPPFYAAAPFSTDGRTDWVFTGTDRRNRLQSINGIEELDSPDWGSDIASLKTDCRPGSQILASAKATASFSDSLQAFEIEERKAAPVSQPIDFEGTITALWTEMSGRNAVVIVHRGKTGDYEAFRLAVACGH